jgi:hypothetical protein
LDRWADDLFGPPKLEREDNAIIKKSLKEKRKKTPPLRRQ